MDWRTEILEIESHLDLRKKMNWNSSILSIKRIIEQNSNDMDMYIRAIYITHHILLEEDATNCERNKLEPLLKKTFDKSYNMFCENAEYLFFIGKILHIAEWYFGLNDEKLAVSMQKKAMDKEPCNLLYEWAYRLSCENDIVADFLASKIIDYENDKVNWLKSKGFAGNYILEHLQMSKDKYDSVSNSTL